MPRTRKAVVSVDPEFHDRMRRAWTLAGVANQAQLMRRLKISRQLAHKYWHGLTGRDTIRAADLYHIAKTLNASQSWLLTGVGQMFPGRRLTAEQLRVIEIYDAFPKEHEKWRDGWVSDGVTVLERLGLKPSKHLPYPIPKAQ